MLETNAEDRITITLKDLNDEKVWNQKIAEAWFEIEDDYKEILFKSKNIFQKIKFKRELNKIKKIINSLPIA